MIIYKIQNKINGKIYIGMTKYPLSKRIAEHIRDNKSYIQKALNKYGLQSFEISVIDEARDWETLADKELFWICFHDCKAPNGYNLTDGGEGLINPSQEVRDNIAKKVKALPHNENFTFKGHSHREESKKQTSATCKKTMADPEVRARMSASGLGRIFTEEHCKNIGISKTGVPRTDAHLFSARWLEVTSRPDYVNPMQGQKRPDLAERNRAGKGRKDSEETLERKRAASAGKPKSAVHIQHIAEAKTANKEKKQRESEGSLVLQ